MTNNALCAVEMGDVIYEIADHGPGFFLKNGEGIVAGIKKGAVSQLYLG